jgi:WD40 repeat protein
MQVRHLSAVCVAVLATSAGACAALAADMVQLTHDGRFKCTPVVAGAGGEIVYAELANPTLYRLMKLTLKDGTTQPLRPQAQTSEFEPALSADGKIFAFLKTSGVLRVNLVIQDEAGVQLGDVPPGDGFSGMRSPAVAPDHSRVVYSFAEGGRQQLFVVRSDGTGRQTLADSQGINNWPAFSPDGRAIVFASSRDGDFEVYRMSFDGSDVRRLTHSPGQDIRPRFSPDGKRICFTSHRDGNAEIYVMDADGSHVRRITDSPDRDDYAHWLPDGKRLVMVSEHSGRHDLFTVNVDP